MSSDPQQDKAIAQYHEQMTDLLRSSRKAWSLAFRWRSMLVEFVSEMTVVLGDLADTTDRLPFDSGEFSEILERLANEIMSVQEGIKTLRAEDLETRKQSITELSRHAKQCLRTIEENGGAA